MPINVINGTDGDDFIQSTNQRDMIVAGLGDDHVFMNGGHDTAYGEAGNDSITGYSGGDVIYGGDGDDTLGSFAFQSDQVTRLFGGAGNDDLASSGQSPVISGGVGDDTVSVFSASNGSVYGGAGTDKLVLNFSGLPPDDRIVAVATGSDAGVQIGLTGFLTVGGFELIVITTGAGDDYVLGGALGDTMFLGAGANTALGQAGDDYLAYLAGSQNFLDGGAGSDTLRVQQLLLDQALTLTVIGTNGVDGNGSQLTGFEHWVVSGARGDDSALLGAKLDLFYGGAGQDTCHGMGGIDRLVGGAGDDLLFGGAGADALAGGDGSDTLSGGLGADRFLFGQLDQAQDMIVDFVSGEDHISIRAWALDRVLPRGPVADTDFHLDTAVGTDAQFVFRQGAASGTHDLIWDTNGADAGGESLIATLDGGRMMVASDILIS